MRRFVLENGLSITFGLLFLGTLVAEALVGHSDFNHAQVAHAGETISLSRYVTSAAYWADVMENWQSEYLQFTLFILATVWLVQRGSPESKPVDERGAESDAEQKIGEHAEADSPRWAKAGGLRTFVYGNSLLAAMVTIWLASWSAQAVAGRVGYNRTLQNWQSEFLAVGSFVVLSVFLRQRGSSQSKPVGASHTATGVEG